ncbi:Golgi SNAP receptor complex member 1 isoform X2 [Neovison vison]|uniref:Golgi SNAP receptor complex member 1 isoform X2 n=1 Tax=Neovison vison TaxID=452646 RepID=UPI001CF05081|nr:Golgi SNAP receptor complex member 1 isoform X2 [Neogale vison]
MAAGTSNYWEDLRKQARQLENELDLKLVSFSKLCTSYSHSSARDGRRDSSDTTPLLNGSSQDRMFETMAIEIEQLLARLTGVNDKMAEYTNSAGVPSLNAALMHTLQRHRDILQDYTHEFHKTKANFMAIRERENLMGSVRKDIESYKSGSGVNNRRTELFLKEHDHLRNYLWSSVVQRQVTLLLTVCQKLRSSDRRDNKHCYGNKRKYDFPERNVEVDSEQNEYFGHSILGRKGNSRLLEDTVLNIEYVECVSTGIWSLRSSLITGKCSTDSAR